MKKLKITNHVLIPEHKKLSEAEKKQLLEKYNISFRDLPNINIKDPAISSLSIKEGDVIKIVRRSPTSGKVVFYRGVIDA